MANDKVQILKNAKQWQETDTLVMMGLKLALEAKQRDQDTLVKAIVAHSGNLTKRDKQPYQHPEWMVTAPITLMETSKNVNGKTYVWCTKCRRGAGLWVCTHTTDTHQSNPRRFPGRLAPNSRGQQTPIPRQLLSQPPHTFPTPLISKEIQAQLSLTDYLDAYFGSSNEDAQDKRETL
jgi:hypothetical protein